MNKVIATVGWDLLFSEMFLSTTLQVFLMGLLTTTKNIYGTSEITHCRVDIDREIYSAGVQTAFCGLLGGMSDPLQLPALLLEVVWTGAAWQCSLGTP